MDESKCQLEAVISADELRAAITSGPSGPKSESGFSPESDAINEVFKTVAKEYVFSSLGFARGAADTFAGYMMALTHIERALRLKAAKVQ